ncbi:MAG TPA: DUF5597 domain-containing protein, partial [Pseudolysinimonas sp.]|nr:DUF5597 domain-containing protein [Pseudolysinimonas sp.]
ECFGTEADEAFMAHAYATYVEVVAAAGRAEFDVPLYVNAWLDSNGESDGGDSELALSGGARPGEYPSGGPLRHTAPVWRAATPTVDFFAPDIYFGSFDVLAREYRQIDGILFIPEMRCDRTGVVQMFRAIGAEGAAGVSPFAVDAITPGEDDFDHVADAFRLLRALGGLMARDPGLEVRGFSLEPGEGSIDLAFGETEFIIAQAFTEIFPADGAGFGCLVRMSTGEFYALGRGYSLSLRQSETGRRAFLRAEELDPAHEHLEVARVLNGDESGEWIRMTALRQTQSAVFPIRQNIRMSGLVRFTTYAY